MAIPQRQLRDLVIALRASTDPTAVGLLATANYGKLTEWLNDNSATKAWMGAASKRDLFEAMNIATYDSVAAGKKDSWKLMMDLAPIDFSRLGMRKGILDIFVTADANAALASLTEWATNAEALLGGDPATSGTTTAIKRKWTGTIELPELKNALATR